MNSWKRVVFASDCYPCELCEEPVCPTCKDHYSNCNCPGPSQDDLYEYSDVDGVLYARLLDNQDE